MIALIDVELVAGPADVGAIDGSDVPVDETIVVVVSDRLAHAIFFLRGVGAGRYLCEGSVGVVPEVMAGAEICNQQ